MLLDALLIFGYAVACIASLICKTGRRYALLGLGVMTASAAAAEIMHQLHTPAELWRGVMLIAYFSLFIATVGNARYAIPSAVMAVSSCVVAMLTFVPAGPAGDAIDAAYAAVITAAHLWYIISIFNDMSTAHNDNENHCCSAGRRGHMARAADNNRSAK